MTIWKTITIPNKTPIKNTSKNQKSKENSKPKLQTKTSKTPAARCRCSMSGLPERF